MPREEGEVAGIEASGSNPVTGTVGCLQTVLMMYLTLHFGDNNTTCAPTHNACVLSLCSILKTVTQCKMGGS